MIIAFIIFVILMMGGNLISNIFIYEEFIISELQNVYENILLEKLLAAVFRRTIASRLEDTGKMTGNAGHRPSRIFRYKGKA